MSRFHCGECGKQTDERQTAIVNDLLVCFDCEERSWTKQFSDKLKVKPNADCDECEFMHLDDNGEEVYFCRCNDTRI